MKNWLLVLILSACMYGELAAQRELKLVQFSGYVVTADSLMSVPFTHITIMNRGRVATAGMDGYFSLAAALGDTLYFTCIGFKPAVYIIPKNMETDKVSIVQLMSRSEVYLRETIVLPWRREDFHQVFLDTRPPDDDMDRARKNLDHERLAEAGQYLERDGEEAAKQSLQMQSAKKYYYGQAAPQNIFNPLAWAEFIKAWKRGDFKKKESSTGQ